MGIDTYRATANAWDIAASHAQAPRFETREAWLKALAVAMHPWFADLGVTLGKYRVAVGFPSSGRGSSAIGQCFAREMAADEVYEVWIAPQYGHGMELRVSDILAHELCHVADFKAGHGKAFKRLAEGLGLEGPMTATVAGPEFSARVLPILADLGPMPHGAHQLGIGSTGGEMPRPRCPKPGRPPQTARMIKCQCPDCGYVARTARTWIDKAGAPICPTDARPMIPA